jgi:hypothetical protein
VNGRDLHVVTALSHGARRGRGGGGGGARGPSRGPSRGPGATRRSQDVTGGRCPGRPSGPWTGLRFRPSAGPRIAGGAPREAGEARLFCSCNRNPMIRRIRTGGSRDSGCRGGRKVPETHPGSGRAGVPGSVTAGVWGWGRRPPGTCDSSWRRSRLPCEATATTRLSPVSLRKNRARRDHSGAPSRTGRDRPVTAEERVVDDRLRRTGRSRQARWYRGAVRSRMPPSSCGDVTGSGVRCRRRRRGEQL